MELSEQEKKLIEKLRENPYGETHAIIEIPVVIQKQDDKINRIRIVGTEASIRL